MYLPPATYKTRFFLTVAVGCGLKPNIIAFLNKIPGLGSKSLNLTLRCFKVQAIEINGRVLDHRCSHWLNRCWWSDLWLRSYVETLCEPSATADILQQTSENK